ncbi:Uncharacterised protein [Citrobacter braakii]|nr:Uncharacterised protein [Citrobacter braakii]
MVTKLQISCAAPVGVCGHAAAELSRFSCGIKNYSRIKPNFYLVIRIGRRWRLLSKNGGKVWSTHDPRRAEKRIECISVDTYGIETYRDWALTTHGGTQFDLLADAYDKSVCNSVYAGVCE